MRRRLALVVAVTALLGLTSTMTAGAAGHRTKVPRYTGDAPGSVTCTASATAVFTPALSDAGGGTKPTKLTGKLVDCTTTDGVVTITAGKLSGTFAPSHPQTCPTLTSLTTPANLVVTWKGTVNGAVGLTTYAGKASLAASLIASKAESVAGDEFGFPTPAAPEAPVSGSFAGGASANLTISSSPSSLDAMCDTKATGGTGKGVRKLIFGGTVTVGLTNPVNNAASLATDAHESFCAILTTAVQCWGDDETGELGDGTTTTSSVAEPVTGLANATALVSDGAHSYCAIVASADVDCWGSNASGELGNGTTTDSSVPVAVTGITSAASITGDGDGSYCVVLEAGTVECWGANGFGQLGHGTTTNSSVPVIVTGLTGAVAVTGDGDGSYCALLETEAVECWGANVFGQLGNGTTTESSTAVVVTGLTDADALASDGVDSFCAELSTDGVACWGGNFAGELGNGTTTKSTVPVNVSGLTTATEVFNDGAESYCALLERFGTVDCWGYNGFGQLGNGTTTNSSVPVAVSGLTGVSAVVSDNENSYCALVSGTITCWGANPSGELGDGTTTSSSVPVTASESTPATSLVGGVNPTGDNERAYCAVLSSAQVVCWGSNQFGELGNATKIASTTPVTVVEP